MCGIAGIILFKEGQIDPDKALAEMVKSLHHRGPDDFGYFKKDNIYLGHTRLSIIDIAGGHQPIHSHQDDIIIGNGEIYNYVELKETIRNQNYQSQSDFEPALYACIENGLMAGINSWRGMFAASVWLKNVDNFICVRDPFGIKPFYYALTADYFAFASEPKALLNAGLAEAALDTQQVLTTLNLNYTPFEHTVFSSIKRLLPGERINLNHHNAKITKSCNDIIQPKKLSFSDPIKAFDRIFEDSVLVHQRSDVPYGLFLSGGIDSSCILTMMARLNETPVKTFTCGFDSDAVHDERRAAQRMADHFKTDHVETIFTFEDFMTMVPRVAAALDDPTFDPAVLPTYKLGKLAKEKVTVVLSGEGGDEVFAGYGRYRKFSRHWLLGGGKFANKHLFPSDAFNIPWTNPLSPLQKEILNNNHLDCLQKVQAYDIKTWLPADLLLKLDRCLMAHSLEGRTPFLDAQVFEFGFNLEQKYKIRNGQGKWILREWLNQNCPAAEPFARKKGFTVPVYNWITQCRSEILPKLLDHNGLIRIMKPEQIKNALHHPKSAWPLLFYAIWYNVHIQQYSPKTDLLKSLD